MTRSRNKVPALPNNQEKLTSKYSGSNETTKTDVMNMIFPKHANKKNKNETPSQDLLLKFNIICGILDPKYNTAPK